MGWVLGYLDQLEAGLDMWAAIGFFGQLVFGIRFFVQWFHAERVGRSEIPLMFWYISIIGALVTLFYAIHIANAVFIFAQAGGLIVYVRNLWLIYARRDKVSASTGDA